MNVNRTTYGVSFNTGISTAEYTESSVGQTPGQTQKSILPGSTTVTEALASVFPKDPTVGGAILNALAQAGNSMLLRTSNGFHAAAKKTIRGLKSRGPASQRAAGELEALLDDTELLNQYRAALLES